jgi:Protein of unknown function (DUF3800)
MANEYIIHCDESTVKGEYYSNFYGGALVRSSDLEAVKEALRTKKRELHLNGEIKWDKVTANYLTKYKEMMDLFFGLIGLDLIKIRIMFTQNAHQPINLTEQHVEDAYFILYYHFIKHGFGLIHSAEERKGHVRLRLLLDQLPDTREKVERFKAYLCALAKNNQFREARISFTKEDISSVVSHDHDVLQCLDIVLGSMQFRLNNRHLLIPRGAKRRGKRTRAKEALYKHINERIREIYPHFNIGISTGVQGEIGNRWHHPYRHWLFLPAEREFDPSRTKAKR